MTDLGILRPVSTYAEFFERIADARAHDWQTAIGEDVVCRDRSIRIPTGFGKTAGVVLAWMFHRLQRGDTSWPTRLAFCLPMRVLVEQSERVIKGWLAKVGFADVPVFVLLGGREEARWVDQIDRPAVLIGTQDMLLSRALNRGYGSPRALWPMEMGLLHHDTLWVVDEVQLMDVGLSTSAQMRAFRAADTGTKEQVLRPAVTWWMSATFQRSWLETVDHAPLMTKAPLAHVDIAAPARRGGLWEVTKRLERVVSATAPEEVAAILADRHKAGQVSLAILNTVDRAVKTFRELEKIVKKRKLTVDLRLVHSRFRGAERAGWDFLRREECGEGSNRIIVATQVVEAGVDLSAALLVTDLAPWPSLVQRFGRCARYAGECGEVVVAGAPPDDDRKAAPYAAAELAAAATALTRLGGSPSDVSPRSLEEAEAHWAATDTPFVAQLFPYAPRHVLRRLEFDDLFDTSPDLSGADLDVGRFIRSGEERDVRVFWRPIDGQPRALVDRLDPPGRAELCPVPVGDLKDWLKKTARPAYALDFLDGEWKRPARIVPGMNLALPASAGGYDARVGWDPSSKTPVPIVLPAEATTALATSSAAADDDGLSAAPWKTIGTHGKEAAVAVRAIAAALALPAHITDALVLAARWHDVGKAHEHFQGAIRAEARAAAPPIALRRDLAKAPSGAWRRPHPYPARPGLRHELVSTLALFETLRRAAPHHPALLGPHVALLTAMGEEPTGVPESERLEAHPLARELASLEASDIDLIAWLVCTHHGKVRTTWSSTPRDQEMDLGAIHGVVDGDVLPDVSLFNAGGERALLPRLSLSLDPAAMGVSATYGSSWVERVRGLLARFGPTQLAALEAVLRVADFRASALTTEDDV